MVWLSCFCSYLFCGSWHHERNSRRPYNQRPCQRIGRVWCTGSLLYSEHFSCVFNRSQNLRLSVSSSAPSSMRPIDWIIRVCLERTFASSLDPLNPLNRDDQHNDQQTDTCAQSNYPMIRLMDGHVPANSKSGHVMDRRFNTRACVQTRWIEIHLCTQI